MGPASVRAVASLAMPVTATGPARTVVSEQVIVPGADRRHGDPSRTRHTSKVAGLIERPAADLGTRAQHPRAILGSMRPVDALYENGLLRPLSPLPLRSGERVALIVVRRPDPTRWNLTQIAAHADDDLALAEAGLADWAAALDREDRG